MQPEFHSGAVTRPLSAILQLAMMGCPALRAERNRVNYCTPRAVALCVEHLTVRAVQSLLDAFDSGVRPTSMDRRLVSLVRHSR